MEILTDNANFDEDHDAKLASLLHKVAERIEAGRFEKGEACIVRDGNGNNVGSWELRED